MNAEKKQASSERMMRIVSPNLYNHVTAELEKMNIHSYDIEANVIEEDSGLQVIVRFGEGFTQERSQLFSYDTVTALDKDIDTFIKSIGEDCKQIMIADYFKMMKM
ncbi:hypothetical protein [Virgibacillus alimentarius]|uniref:Uncharacterized protein n=1 Tax=Virgibacillus alimentarius TaxID=698769 RepID=A0ABS4SAU6_9BACI|nr:hypothetical protein [Virgibacillus alimentarius]MBP2258534.1 hypothetical protein [Virgibacillus alimentarius]